MTAKLKIAVLGAAFVASVQVGAQVPRTDTAVCALPGGHRIELKSRYLWVPLNPHPHSNRTHFDQENYRVRLLPQSGKALDLEVLLDGQVMDEQVASGFCAEFGSIGRLVFTREDLILLPRAQRLPMEGLWPLGMDASRSGRRPEHQALLLEHGLAFPSGWAFALGAKGELLAEQGLLSSSHKGQIAAVLRFESRNQAKSWQALGLFKDSALFELGKSWEGQPFLARPIRVNGRPVKQAGS